MTIRILPPHVSAMIAAGEVIERPASVVRELVENALDAGAQSIEVHLQNKSLSRIVVLDDGKGMGPDDLALAHLNHATSKLAHDDVFNVHTLGFRGEALPSIAIMASLTIVSRPAGQDVAFISRVVNGKAQKVMPSAGGYGTRIEVEGLFDNHPARKAFLKSFNKEFAQIVNVVDALALAHPETRFTLRNGNQVIAYRQTDALARIGEVRGEPLSKDGVAVNYDRDGIKVHGLVSLPTVMDTAGSGHLDIIVNGRLVTDRSLSATVQSVYKNLIGTTHRPFATLMLTLDPRMVNLNVHPAKAEIRFRDGVPVADVLREAVSKALAESGMRSPASLTSLTRKLMDVQSDPVADKRRLPLGRFLAQAHSRYLITETADGIVVVDQHAGAERVLLERLKKAAAGFPEEFISFPSPYTRAVSAEVAAQVADLADILSSLGFLVSSSLRKISLASYPAILSGKTPDEIIDLIIEHCHTGTVSGLMGDALWELLATSACKAAIKAGDALTPEEADRLLREIEATPNGAQCNHGRPVLIHFSNIDFDKSFERS